jgi:hypothetical protein
MRWSSVFVVRGVGVAVGLVAVALVVAGAAGASASRCGAAGTRSPDVGPGDNYLRGVAANTACNAWAVGEYANSNDTVLRTLIEHWNGKAWRVQKSQNPSRDSGLDGVTAISARNAWAVGSYSNSKNVPKTLIEHWNGKAWKVQPSPNAGSTRNGHLTGVVATSAKNAWAVGFYFNSKGDTEALIEHWNGKAWRRKPSPNRGRSSDLAAVAATSASNAWAVGKYFNGTAERTLIEHWNAGAWTVKTSPNRGSSTAGNELSGVAAISAKRAWVVGDFSPGTTFHTLVERWHGKAWKVRRSPHPGSFSNLNGVAATSRTDVWAVGGHNLGHTLIEHWNGTAWKVQQSPSPPGGGLIGVAATSSTNAWAVGIYFNKAGVRQTLIEHWNGRAWKG